MSPWFQTPYVAANLLLASASVWLALRFWTSRRSWARRDDAAALWTVAALAGDALWTFGAMGATATRLMPAPPFEPEMAAMNHGILTIGLAAVPLGLAVRAYADRIVQGRCGIVPGRERPVWSACGRVADAPGAVRLSVGRHRRPGIHPERSDLAAGRPDGAFTPRDEPPGCPSGRIR